MSKLKELIRLLTDEENQPHQYIGDGDLLQEAMLDAVEHDVLMDIRVHCDNAPQLLEEDSDITPRMARDCGRVIDGTMLALEGFREEMKATL